MMEANIPQTTRPPALINTEKLVGKPGGFLQAHMFKNKQRHQMLALSQMPKANTACNLHPVMEVRRSTKKHPVLKTGGLPLSVDDALLLKNKSQEIEPYIGGRCIYLVGMMGSGKTTVGRILADVLGYSFFDSDALVEQAVGGMPVSEIFKLHGEGFFRENETEVLQNLSLMQRLVVSTGGGAVVRPINWKYMRHGISVWLDVPLEALARRIAAVGTSSRPLLHHESEDAYSKTFVRLTTIMQERSEAYANANARVSLECIAAKLGFRDVANLSPAMIAIETLEQIESFLKGDGVTI